jgi:N-acetylglucosaminyl-diphospho-decaprenol L-rhamnosyltransferase
MDKPQFVSVIIVNYNSGRYAKVCIESLLKQVDVHLEIIVIDNASGDDSVNVLKNAFAEKITLIESTENLGFGKANNLGAAQTMGEFLLLLNPDTEISDNRAIAQLIEYMRLHPQCGLLGPAIFEPRKNKQVMPRFTYPQSKKLKFTPKFGQLPGQIAWLLGACMLVPRAVFNQINGFDEDYFLYGEDADIGLRLRQQGYEIGYCDTVKIMHVSGASELGANSLDKWLRKKRGVMLFCTKHYDPRDVLNIAKSAIAKSKLYLAMMGLSKLFGGKNNVAFIDKKYRLQATIIAAEEVINPLKSSEK